MNTPQIYKIQIQVIIVLLMVILGQNENANAGISLAGTSGLINIPTAHVISDHSVIVGVGYVNRNSAYLENGRYDNFPFYIVLGYLPRLEFSAGVTFVPGDKSYDGTNTYKDGVVSLQFLLLKETKFTPAVAIGARDIYSFILLNTTFMVMSKTVIHKTHTNLKIHAGYGSDIIDHHLGVPKNDRKFPVGHTIVGLFGGFEINWKNAVTYMFEFDSQKPNCGFRFHPFSHFCFDLHLLNMEDLSGSLNFSFDL